MRDELLGLDSKDADFLVLGVDHDELRAVLEPHGRVEDLEVAGQPSAAALPARPGAPRRARPHGIEFAPPRASGAPGPGGTTSRSSSTPSRPVEDDLAPARLHGQRDRAPADRRRARRSVRRPDDLDDRVLRTVSPRSLAEDPLRIVRGLRLVSQLDLAPDDETLAQMRRRGPNVRLVSAERIGGGLHADGMGELSKLLLGASAGEGAAPRARHRRAARDHPRVRAAIGYDADDVRQDGPVDEHVFTVVEAAAAVACRCGSPRCFHDLGKPLVGRATSTTRRRARASPTACSSACATRRALRRYVVELVARHAFQTEDVDELFARRFLARARRRARARSRGAQGGRPAREERRRARGARARRCGCARCSSRRRRSPTGCADLAVDGVGPARARLRARGPQLGAALPALLDDVVVDPCRNDATGCSSARRSSSRDATCAGTRRARTRSSSRRASAASARARSPRSTSAGRPATTSSASTRTAGARAPRSARTPTRLALNYQVHSTLVHRARAGARGEPRRRALDGRAGPADPRDERRLPAGRARADERRRARGRRRCTSAGAACSTGSSRARRRGARRRRARGRGRPGDRPVLLRGARGRRRSVPRALRPGDRPRRRSSISGARPSARSATPASRASTASTSAPPAARALLLHRRDGKPRGVQGVLARVA